MWEHAGIARAEAGLRTCLADLDTIEARLPEGATEEANLVDTGRLIVRSALMRDESRGGHFRSDYPQPERDWAGLHIRVVSHQDRARAAAQTEP
jgi:L-aspartate oxidase